MGEITVCAGSGWTAANNSLLIFETFYNNTCRLADSFNGSKTLSLIVSAINKRLLTLTKRDILMILDLERLDWSRRTNCFVCNDDDTPVSSGIFYEVRSNNLKHTFPTNNTTGQPESGFFHGNLDGSAFRCPHCGPYVVSGTLMATANASGRVQTYLSRHPEYRDNPVVIHTYNVDF
ncbi:hypothetical protein Q7X49_000062 [Salmonella enterica]|nr:hypothetical protein [Salmonella enterica]